MATVFFSYSHKDSELRDQLQTHLAMLQRQGLISTWHDRQIKAGDDIDHSISKELKTADIVLLLVSADFLASDYCYDTEMTFAMEKHNEGKSTVIPIILHPCDWMNAPFGKLKALPNDAQPVSKFANLHEAFHQITSGIREVVEDKYSKVVDVDNSRVFTASRQPNNAPRGQVSRSSNLAIKKTFSDHERDSFMDDAFEYIYRFFDGSLDELGKRNNEVSSRLLKQDGRCFTAAIYIDGEKRSACTIWVGGFFSDENTISFNSNDKGKTNSLNDSLTVDDDGSSLFMKPTMMSHGRDGFGDKLSQQGAAEYFWHKLIQPLQ